MSTLRITTPSGQSLPLSTDHPVLIEQDPRGFIRATVTLILSNGFNVSTAADKHPPPHGQPTPRPHSPEGQATASSDSEDEAY